jgi:hypothetical protein
VTDSITRSQGQFVQAHVGPAHVEKSARGIEVTLATVTPHATLTREQARNLGTALIASAE